MSLFSALLTRVAPVLALRRERRPRRTPSDPRILVIQRGKMSDMIYALPLLHALRRHFRSAHLAVACDLAGEPIALACPAVNEVIVLKSGWLQWLSLYQNAAALQNYDWAIAAMGGFDEGVAALIRLTNTALRVGFERKSNSSSIYYTDPVALPDESFEEHQIETLLRLLKPMGMVRTTAFSVDLTLRLPDDVMQFAAETREKPPFASASKYMLINISSTVPLKFREEDFITLTKRILNLSDMAIALVAAPDDQQKAHELASCMASRRITAVETASPLELAALLDDAEFLVTPEGGAAHLAAAMKRPALVLWSEGIFKKWRSRYDRHFFVHALPGERFIPVDRVMESMQSLLALTNDDVHRSLDQFLRPPDEDPLED